jgi:hypothetical protein
MQPSRLGTEDFLKSSAETKKTSSGKSRFAQVAVLGTTTTTTLKV